MSHQSGPHTADPCPRCSYEAVRPGTPPSTARPESVGYLCDRCGHTWSRPVETDLQIHDTVRADLPHATLYGSVHRLEDDRVLIRGTAGDRHRWVERWRVTLY